MTKRDPTIWRTRDGREIEIVRMDTGHLKNTVAFLRKRGWITHAEAVPLPRFPTGFTGEYAEMFAEQEWNAEMDRCLRQKLSRRLALMEAELARRSKQTEEEPA
jgi:hypothetical protein